MFHPLHLVPIAGEESQFTLTSRSKKTHKGFIDLFMSIQADTNKQLEVFLKDFQPGSCLWWPWSDVL